MRRVVAVLACVAALGCQRQPTPHVIVIVLDAVRADRIGAFGSTRHLTPFLDGLARRGTVFRSAFAASTDTLPSVASLLTSRYPTQHGTAGRDGRLPDGERTLAEALGTQAFGFVGSHLMPADHGWGQGFHTWSADALAKLPANELRKRVLGWIDVVRGRRSTKPLFLYVHYMDAHAPYAPPARYRARFAPASAGVDVEAANHRALEMRFAELTPADVAALGALYDAEVAYLDGELRKLFAGLARRRFLDDAIVVVTADHGEELGEHGLVGHGFGLYDQELHVPLLVLGRDVPAGQVVDEPVSLVDVAPTILMLAGLPPEARFAGRSLFGEHRPAGDVVAQLPLPSPQFDPRRHTAALVRGPLRLLVLADAWATRLGQAELYDVAADPAESQPLGYLGGPRALPPTSSALADATAMLAALRATESRLR